METLDDLFQKGQEVRALVAKWDPSHYTLPGIDQLAPDLKRIIDEALFGSVWTRPGLETRYRCMCTMSALMALGQLPLLRRHIERSLNLGLTPEQVVEVFTQLTFYVDVPSVETAMRILKGIFEERGIEFTPSRICDASMPTDDLNQIGLASYEKHIGQTSLYPVEDPNSIEMEVEQLINDYHWGAIHSRPNLDEKSRAICALSAMTVLGEYDRQIRRRIEGALRVGLSPREILEVFVHLILYGGYINSRTAMRVARSVFTEQVLTV